MYYVYHKKDNHISIYLSSWFCFRFRVMVIRCGVQVQMRVFFNMVVSVYKFIYQQTISGLEKMLILFRTCTHSYIPDRFHFDFESLISTLFFLSLNPQFKMWSIKFNISIVVSLFEYIHIFWNGKVTIVYWFNSSKRSLRLKFVLMWVVGIFHWLCRSTPPHSTSWQFKCWTIYTILNYICMKLTIVWEFLEHSMFRHYLCID